MRRACWCAVVAVLLQCEIAAAVTIETVPVVNPGNAGNVQPEGTFGAVAYEFRIGKYEVTNSQYAEFLNAVDLTGANGLGLYIAAMTTAVPGGINYNAAAANGVKYSVKPNRGQNPVVFLNWYDAIRFTNWMHNGQGAGDTETGAYTLLGGTPTPTNGPSITRNPGAKWFLPSENEWHKAAYHQPAAQGGDGDDYWAYPTRANAAPYSDQPPGIDAPDPTNAGNFYKNDSVANGYDDGYALTASAVFFQNVNHLTDAGAYSQSVSYYGTFDQGGNVHEWNEQAFSAGANRSIRGGSWQGVEGQLAASNRQSVAATFESGSVGFRIATIAAVEPEPLAGDYNGNGTVDAADYVVWRHTLGQSGAGLAADGNGNLEVDADDYMVWRSNFGHGASNIETIAQGVSSVPEPATFLLMTFACVLRCSKRRRAPNG